LFVILGLIVVGAAAALIVVFVVLPNALKTAAAIEYYEIVDDKVPSIKLALGEERKVAGASSSVGNGVHTKTFVYETDGNQGVELAEYAAYLKEKDGFEFITSFDFSTATGTKIQLARNSVKDGYMVVVQLDWTKTGYTVSLMWGEGEVTPVAAVPSSPSATPVAVNDPDPSPTVSADVETNLDALPLLVAKDTYTLNDNTVTSITAALGVTRELIGAGGGSGDNVDPYTSCTYGVPGTEQGAELQSYAGYLEDYEGFTFVTDWNFGLPVNSGIQLAKNAVQPGYILLIEFEWDTNGYKITLSHFEGTITFNDETDFDPSAGGLPPMLQTLTTGTYTLGFTMSINGIEVTGYNSQQGDVYGTIMKFTLGDMTFTSRTVTRDGYTYDIDVENETMTKRRSTASDLEALDTNYDDFAILSQGTGSINGESLPYVEYGSKSGNSYGKYYLKDGDVFAIEIPDDDAPSVMIITGYSNQPLPELFEIPTGFTVTES
jgi:hypothetical protein